MSAPLPEMPRAISASAGNRGQPAFGLNQQVIGLALRVRPRVAIARDRAADQSRIILAQSGRREAELIHRARLEILDQHVGFRDQVFQRGAAIGLREIDDARVLAAVEPDEIARLAFRGGVVTAREIALRAFDLDDMRAGVGKARRAERRGDGLLDGDDGETFKGEHKSVRLFADDRTDDAVIAGLDPAIHHFTKMDGCPDQVRA